jgi:hypothetical protein
MRFNDLGIRVVCDMGVWWRHREEQRLTVQTQLADSPALSSVLSVRGAPLPPCPLLPGCKWCAGHAEQRYSYTALPRPLTQLWHAWAVGGGLWFVGAGFGGDGGF